MDSKAQSKNNYLIQNALQSETLTILKFFRTFCFLEMWNFYTFYDYLNAEDPNMHNFRFEIGERKQLTRLVLHITQMQFQRFYRDADFANGNGQRCTKQQQRRTKNVGGYQLRADKQ